MRGRMDKYFGYSVGDQEIFFNCENIMYARLSVEDDNTVKLRPANWYVKVYFRDLTEEEIENDDLDDDICITFQSESEAREVFDYFNKYIRYKSFKVIK
jgi:predicted glycosyltransferase